jgi:PAS domain S-box-containing protein
MQRASTPDAIPSADETVADIAALLEAAPDPPGATPLDRIAARVAAVSQPESPWVRYGAAIAIVLVASLISRGLDEYSDAPAYMTMTIGVIFASWFSGFRAGLLATVLATLIMAFVIIEPRYDYPLGTDDIISLAVFAFAAMLAGAMYHVVHVITERSMRLAADRERLLRAVVASEERWHSLTDTMPALVSSIADGGRVTYLNKTYTDYSGVTAADISADPMVIVHPDDVNALSAAWRQSASTHEPFSLEWRVRRRDGAYRWHQGTAVPVREPDGGVSGWVCSAVDIDDRRRAEEALAESRRQLSHRLAEMEALFNTAPVGIAIAEDPDCTYIRANMEFTRILRAPSPDANISLSAKPGLRADWYRIQQRGIDIDPGDLPMQRAARSGAPILGEQLDVVFEDGDVTSIFGGAMPLRDDGGKIRGVISAWIDITEQERYRREQRLLVNLGDALNGALEYDETMMAALSAVAPAFADWCAIYVHEDDGRLERRSAGSIYQDAIDRRTYPSLDSAPSWIRSVMQSGEQRLYDDIPAGVAHEITSDPEHRALVRNAPTRSGIVAPLRAPGRVIGAIAFGMIGGRRFRARDEHLASEVARRCGLAIENARLYRDAQVLLEQLRAANSAKDEFLGMVSHELKTPITTIMGNAEVLRKRAALIDEASRADALDDIRNEAERLNRIIGNLLMLARVDRGAPMEWEPILLRRLVEAVVQEHRLAYPQRDVRFETVGESGAVIAVVGYVEQVVQNLLSNAEKYSAPDTPIDVCVARNGGDVEVRVMDRGPGIPDGDGERLFTAFYRAPQTSGTAKGVGIGLAVCKRLVEAQHGAIWATIRSGGGSEFGFRLPIADDA